MSIANGKLIDYGLLDCFSGCLRWGQHKIPCSEARFGSVLAGLSNHLTYASLAIELSTSYLLIRTIGNLLDAMVDIQLTDLDREALHGPIAKKLHDLSKSK